MEGFFTFLLGITFFGIVLFLGLGLISKLSGRPIKNSGIVSGGQTIADPEMLDNVGRGLRKLVDKRYKVRKQIEEEMNEELTKTIGPIDRVISTCTFMAVQNFPYSPIFDMNRPDQHFILKAIGFLDSFNNKSSFRDMVGRVLTESEKERIHQIHIELYQQKVRLTEEITEKYNKKRDELLRYL